MSEKYDSTIVEFGNTSSLQECLMRAYYDIPKSNETATLIREVKNNPNSLNNTWPNLMKKLEELSAELRNNSIPKPNAEKIEKENNDMNGVNPVTLIMSIPAIVNVETYNDRCVKVTFADGTFTKAVCGPNDRFDIDVGITICTMKRMLIMPFEDVDIATKLYNKFIRNVHKIMKENEKARKAKEEEEKRIKEKQKKLAMKKKAKMMKRKEEQIDIVKQGYIRAMSVDECEGCRID